MTIMLVRDTDKATHRSDKLSNFEFAKGPVSSAIEFIDTVVEILIYVLKPSCRSRHSNEYMVS